MTYKYESAIGSHVGMVRSNNQDSGFAGVRLFFVADGMGGHAGGDVASALTTKHVAEIDTSPFETASEAAAALEDQLLSANRKLSDTATERPELAGLGTTFTGFFTIKNQLGVAHIGDSRLYRFRDGKLRQLTSDHTFVQRLVDSGQITEEEAKTHPRRSVLMRVLGNVDTEPNVDTEVIDPLPGDIYLLCSDGLCGYVDEKVIAIDLDATEDLQSGVDILIDRALENGAPDNVTVALVRVSEVPAAEVDNATGPQTTAALPKARFVGSAANGKSDLETTNTARARIMSRRRPKRKPPVIAESQFEPRVDEYLAELIAETKRQNWRRRIFWILGSVFGALVILGIILLGYRWTQTQYFVGADEDSVVIYQGVRQELGPIKLYSVTEDTDIPLTSLGAYERRQVERTLTASSLPAAREIVTRIGSSE